MADQDHIVNAGIINNASLKSAYAFLLNTLDKRDLRATAAFVTCFAADPAALRDNLSLFEKMATLNPHWFANVLPALRNGALDGWTGVEFYRSMSAAGHEMAWHGATHLSLSDQTTTDALALEMELASRLLPALGCLPRTIVFPRNQIGHLSWLRNWGFETYRASAPGGLTDRMWALLNEWNIVARHVAEKPRVMNGWHVSPEGHFLNWPSGARALVPVSVTVRRWKSLLRTAVERGGYVHMWFHPHNLITAPVMRVAFEEIMRFVGELVRSGDMVNLTMAEANEHFNTRRLNEH